jgi:hypothetical protein
LAVILVLLPYLLSSARGSDVSVVSSDGRFADVEVLSKGRTYRIIRANFERYKLECKVANVVLQRTTVRPSRISLKHYFNDYTEEKWQLPQVEPHGAALDPGYIRGSVVCAGSIGRRLPLGP